MRSESLPQKTVVLRFDSGSFSDGFQVTLRLLQDGRQIGDDRQLSLPASPHIPELYRLWEQTYRSIGQSRKREPQPEEPQPEEPQPEEPQPEEPQPEEPKSPSSRIQIPAGQITNHEEHSLSDLLEVKRQLSDQLIDWFNQPGFRDLGSSICFSVSGNYASLPIAIHGRTGCVENDRLLRKLPWHLWPLFQKLENAEPILISNYSLPVPSFGPQIRVLIILGSNEGGLDLNQDLDTFKSLGQQGAKILTDQDFKCFRQRNARGEFDRFNCLILPVVQQDLETLHDLLYQNPWDILFFAGHSSSDRSCQEGQLEIRPGLCVPIEAFNAAIQQSVKRGLKLAIFNSCDGLGLAESMIRNQVPNVIVMREPVPDRVAQKFLSYFLDEFLQGHPLSKAVHHARNQLQSLEHTASPYPAASWLPILIKNPNQADLIWPTDRKVSLFKLRRPIAILGGAIGLTLAILAIPKLPKPISQSPQPTLSPQPTRSPNSVQDFGHFKTFAGVEYPVGTYSYGGSTTWAAIETQVLPEIAKATPQFQLKKLDAPPGQIPGSVFGLEMLKQGQVEFSHVSRVSSDSPDELKPYAVAYTFKAIAVHPGVDLQGKGLTLNQIKRICNGAIRNWADVGGPNLPIIVIDRSPQPKLRPSLGDDCAAAQTQSVRTTSAAILKAKDTPGSFMITAATLVVPQCSLQILPVVNGAKATVYPFKETPNLQGDTCQDFPRQIDVEVFRNGSYLDNNLRDTLYVYLNENNPQSLAAGKAYINALRSCEGQTLLEKAGYLRYSETDNCPRTKPE
jgi:ABC-type phosphate transport system substrate-binding protein